MYGIIALSVASSLWALNHHAAFTRALETAPLLLAGGLFVTLMPYLALRTSLRWLWVLPAVYALAWALLGLELVDGLFLQGYLHVGKHLKPDMLNRSILFCVLSYCPVIVITWSLFRNNPNIRLAFTGGLTALVVFVLVLNSSQSAQLVFLFNIIFAVFYPYRIRSLLWIMGGVISLLVLSAPWLAQYMFHTFAVPLSTLPSSEIQQAYMPDRMEIWDFISRYALQRPLTGFGIDATRSVPAFDTEQLFQRGIKAFHPHNFVIQLWMEFGVLGAIFGAAMLSRILWVIKEQPLAHQRMQLPVFIGCLSAAAMTFSIWQGWWIGTLFFTFAMVRFSTILFERINSLTSGPVSQNVYKNVYQN